ncbi:hypothetical protein ACQR0Z_17185 [Bradyrhizobium sp. HKCCYLS3077]|uniref:hypothetical protein n=1 Tax=Bradyrhizobium sp. HKCCYLS3077 TaxID=3420761 RepID=UPI003EB9CA45
MHIELIATALMVRGTRLSSVAASIMIVLRTAIESCIDRDDNACALHRRKIYSASWRHSARTTTNECGTKVIDRRMCDARAACVFVLPLQLSMIAIGFAAELIAPSNAAISSRELVASGR